MFEQPLHFSHTRNCHGTGLQIVLNAITFWLLRYLLEETIFFADCGFKFYPSWLKAIPLMLQTEGVPLIFTEFNQQVCKPFVLSLGN